MTHLGTHTLQTSLTLGTVRIDLTLEMTQTSLAGVGWWTLIVGTSGWYPHTSLLGLGHSCEPFWTLALYILVEDAAESIGSTGTLLLTRINTFEVDADLVTGTVLVVSTSHTADSITAHLAGRTLLGGDTRDHTHARTALFTHQTVVLATTRVPTRA